MNCTFVKNNLFAISENRLPESELSRAKEHIAGCASCTEMMSSFLSVMDVIAKDREILNNPFLGTRILQKMESHAITREHRVLIHMPGALQPVIAVALILLAVLTGFLAGKQGKHLKTTSAYERDLNTMKTDLFISDLNDEDKTMELYK